MHRLTVCLLALAVLCIASTGHAQTNPDRSSQFLSNCTSGSNVEQCEARQEICQRYAAAFTKPNATLASCRKACKKLGYRLPHKYTSLRNCDYIVTHGTELCEQECYRQYPKQ